MKRINFNILITIAFLMLLCSGGFMSQQPQQIARQAAVVAMADTVETRWKGVPFDTAAAAPVAGWFGLSTGQMFDKTAKALAAAPAWTDCVTAITVDANAKLYLDTPPEGLPDGEYVWRMWESAALSLTDPCDKPKGVYVKSGVILRVWDM